MVAKPSVADLPHMVACCDPIDNAGFRGEFKHVERSRLEIDILEQHVKSFELQEQRSQGRSIQDKRQFMFPRASNDDDSEVAQITVSLASLVQLPTEPAVEVEMIECTLQDLVNGDTSETIQNVLRNLRGEHTQKSNVNSTTEEETKGHQAERTSISHGQPFIASRDEDEIKKRMIEKAKRINGAKLNAFALSFVPSSSHESPLVHDDGLSATGNPDTTGNEIDSFMPSNKLNPAAPSFVPHFIGTS